MASGLDELKQWTHERAPRFEDASGPSWPLLTRAITVVIDQVDAHQRRPERRPP
jgi:hypothetical protein